LRREFHLYSIACLHFRIVLLFVYVVFTVVGCDIFSPLLDTKMKTGAVLPTFYNEDIHKGRKVMLTSKNVLLGELTGSYTTSLALLAYFVFARTDYVKLVTREFSFNLTIRVGNSYTLDLVQHTKIHILAGAGWL
jgi:hypothetical protein